MENRKTERVIRSTIITGATGALGQALCRLLISEGVQVFVVCRPESLRAKTLPQHTKKFKTVLIVEQQVRLIKVDVCSPAQVSVL